MLNARKEYTNGIPLTVWFWPITVMHSQMFLMFEMSG